MEAVMAWNKIVNLAALSLALIFAACGGDSGSNASNESGNSRESSQNELINSSASDSWSESRVSSSSFEISDAYYVFDSFDEYMSGSTKNKKHPIAERILYCKSSGDLTDPNRVEIDSVECLCRGASLSVYEKSSNRFFYCDIDVSGWVWKPIQNGDDVLIRKDGLAYKKFADNRDGNTYAMALVNGRLWMLQDMRLNTGENDRCYYSYYMLVGTTNFDTLEHCGLGRSYSEMSALGVGGANLNKGMPLQGICPQGWHIPDTSEWVSTFGVDMNGYGSNLFTYYLSDAIDEAHRKWDSYSFSLEDAEGYWSSTYNEQEEGFYRATLGKTITTPEVEIHDYLDNRNILLADTIKHLTGVRCVKDDRIW